MSAKSKKRQKKLPPQSGCDFHYYCYAGKGKHERGKGVYTVKQLFKRKIVKVLVRSTDKDGHAEFYLYEWWNAKQNESSGWRLSCRDCVVLSIELAKKNNIKMYGGKRS